MQLDRRAFLVTAAAAGGAGCIGGTGGVLGGGSVDVDEARIHQEWSSSNGNEFAALGWTRTDDVRVVIDDEPKTVEPAHEYFFQVAMNLKTEEIVPRGDVELVVPADDHRYTPIEELPDGSPLGSIDDVGEDTVEVPLIEVEQAWQETDSQPVNPGRPIYDIKAKPPDVIAVIDISPWIPDEEAPRYLGI